MPRVEYDPWASLRDERRDYEDEDELAQRSPESFDRVAFAERALALVKLRRTTVAICPGSRRVHVEAGRRWGGAPDERWAILSFPREASRRAIARAVLDLAAKGPKAPETGPWALDVLVALGE